MILSIGTDIVEIDEIKKSIKMSNRFLKRVFTKNEQDYCEQKVNKFEHYAARFAAKEAVMKALGTGWNKGVQWKEIEIGNQGDGKQEDGDGRRKTGDGRRETGDGRQETGDRRRETGDGRTKTGDRGSGKPEVRCCGKTLEIIKEMGVDKIFVSLSHSGQYAVANVIFEGDGRPQTGGIKKAIAKTKLKS